MTYLTFFRTSLSRLVQPVLLPPLNLHPFSVR
jgi:hypothetical protein